MLSSTHDSTVNSLVRDLCKGFFRNYWLSGAIGLSLALQVAVVYVPFLQNAFSTVDISFADWLRCAGGRQLGAVVARIEQMDQPIQGWV